MRAVSPTRSSDTFYYHVKLLTLHSVEPYADPFNFKINLQKGIQKLDSTRKPHTFKGSELNIEDVVTFQMPFYNPIKKKIDFNLLLIEMAQEEIEVCTAVLPVGEHTQDFMKDSSQRIFEGSTSFDDGNFTIDYILYVDRVKASLLALVAGGSQIKAVQPESLRTKQDDNKSSKLSELASLTSPLLKIEPKPETRPQQKIAPTRVAPTRDTKPPVQKVREPQPEPSKIEVQTEEPVPVVNTKKPLLKADLSSRNSKKEFITESKEQRIEIPVPTVIPPPPPTNSQRAISAMYSSKESTGKRHLKAPHSSHIPANGSVSQVDIANEKQRQVKGKAEAPNSKMGLIIGAVIIAALIFGFLFTRSASKQPKGKGRKRRN